MAPKVLVSDKLSETAVQIFRDNGIEVDFLPTLGKEKDKLLELIHNYDGLAIRSATKVTDKLLERADNLKVVGRAGIGVDNVDIPAASKKGVIVMNTPYGNMITTAEHAIAMMFAVARQAITNRMEGQVDRLDRGAVAGLFRIEPQMIVASRHLEIPESSSLSLMLQVSWEPRLQPIVIMQSLESIEATDENGNPIQISRQGNREIPVQGASSATEVSIDLEMPGREVQSIASLHGTFEALVPGQIETFEFGDLLEAQNEEVRRAGVVVTLVQARQNGTIFDVRMRVRFDEAGNALESHRGWIFSNEAYLLDGDGNRVLEAGFETLSQGSNEVGMSYKFVPEGDAADCTFVYRTPGALLQMPIEFELTAIPLP